jgi:hypothetical protein
MGTSSGVTQGICCLFEWWEVNEEHSIICNSGFAAEIWAGVYTSCRVEDVSERSQETGSGEGPPRRAFLAGGKSCHVSHRVLSPTLVSAKKVSAFTHVVLVLAWNLGCRVNNVIGLNLAHMGWADDCLRINFALQKNDQEGDQGQQVRHVFANPLNPAVCPILALGVYLLLFTKGEEDVKLFDGSSQYNHFLTALHDFLEDISELLENEGLSPDCFGAHSMRKVCVCAHSMTKVCLCESFGRLM